MIIESPRTSVQLKACIEEHCLPAQYAKLRATWAQPIKSLAKRVACSDDEVWKHLALLIPGIPIEQLENVDTRLPVSVEKLATTRLTSTRRHYEVLSSACGAKHLQDNEWKVNRRRSAFVSCKGGELPFRIDSVSVMQGHVIESELHYMRCQADPGIIRQGLYLSEHQWPIFYLSGGVLDRRYKVEALERALQEVVHIEECVNLSRIFGIGKLPRNVISVMISYLSDQISESARFIITAVNPFLGFSGVSMLSSGFRPFALCPVAYGYDTDGNYSSRRRGQAQKALWNPPPNMLFVRGTTAESRRLLDNALQNMQVIAPLVHQAVDVKTFPVLSIPDRNVVSRYTCSGSEFLSSD